MIVVIDTNVMFQGLDSDKGASFQILELLKRRKFNIALSYQVITEYEDVLKRTSTLERLKLEIGDIDNVLAFIAYIALPFETYFLMRPNLKDEKDNIFVELAFTSNADFLITNNTKDFKIKNDLKFDNFEICTPRKFIQLWRSHYEN